MLVKTSDLTGPALDWAVTRANYEINFAFVWATFRADCAYSTDWAQSGPIIEREQMGLRWSDGRWLAEWWAPAMTRQELRHARHRPNRYATGPTPLIAAMRCFVASKLGDEVEIPEELRS